jgi:hypothetical protein
MGPPARSKMSTKVPDRLSSIELSILGCGIQIVCADQQAASLLNHSYGWFKQPVDVAQITYRITREEVSEEFSIARNGARPEFARDDGDFLYLFEKDMIIETQKRRSDLYFVHSAVVELDGHALALVAPSGHGKSTTTWGLLHHGLGYLSDELAPIDLTTMRVHPFPHALCLKAAPPDGYPLPKKTIYTSCTAHVPSECLRCEATTDGMPLEAIFFLRFIGETSEPVVQPLGKTEATVRLFANALNPLAHPADGLDGAIEIVSKVRCFELLSSSLRPTCELIKSTFLPAFS